VERACFSPLVFAATGGMGPSTTTVFRKLASMLAESGTSSTVAVYFGLDVTCVFFANYI